MRVLTVRQPWAWAIIHGGKDVENRVRNIAGAYRGPVAIHVALAEDESAMGPRDHQALNAAKDAWFPSLTAERQRSVTRHPWREWSGHIIGLVDLIDVHAAEYCYDASIQRALDLYSTDRPAFDALPDSGAGGILGKAIFCSPWAQDEVHHLVLRNQRSLADPIPYRGALGLRRVDTDTEALVLAAVNP